jgi:Ca2+-binding EF-hand superfamily protein
MIRLLTGSALISMTIAITPAQSQPVPPPGVAQGTSVSSPLLTSHVPPVIRGPQAVSMTMHDEPLTRDQMIRHVREMFARLDANHDGFITKDKVAAFDQKMTHSMRIGARADERFERSRFDRRQGAARKQDRSALFDKLDTNHDGVISRQEFMAARPIQERRVMVMREAEPHSGQAMGEGHMHEMHMRQMGMHGGFAAHLFAMADTNHDGRVSLEEAEAAAIAHFDRMDLNHDGKITPDERRQAHQRMRADHRPF